MASPTILSTRPPKALTSATKRSKHRSTRFLTCSGSRFSLSVTKPTRSANSTVTMRRSSPREDSTCPHDGQKRALSGTDAAHAGHVTRPSLEGWEALAPLRMPPVTPLELLQTEGRPTGHHSARPGGLHPCRGGPALAVRPTARGRRRCPTQVRDRAVALDLRPQLGRKVSSEALDTPGGTTNGTRAFGYDGAGRLTSVGGTTARSYAYVGVAGGVGRREHDAGGESDLPGDSGRSGTFDAWLDGTNDYAYPDDLVNEFDLTGALCITGKNKNGSCGSLSRGAGRVTPAVGRRTGAIIVVAGLHVGRKASGGWTTDLAASQGADKRAYGLC